MWAIVPIKSLEAAKRRLADVLSVAERRALMLAMARDVLTALARSQRLTGVLIVSRTRKPTPWPRLRHRALHREPGRRPVRRRSPRPASTPGSPARPRGDDRPGRRAADRAGEIDEILAGHDSVTIMPDDEHLGTNGLICTPPDRIRVPLRRAQLQTPPGSGPGRGCGAAHRALAALRPGRRHAGRPARPAAPGRRHPDGDVSGTLRHCRPTDRRPDRADGCLDGDRWCPQWPFHGNA
jgi:hypothetical protein